MGASKAVTVTEERRNSGATPKVEVAAEVPDDAQGEAAQPAPRATWLPSRAELRRIAVVALLCVLVFAAAEAIVFYGVGSLLHNRDQRSLSATERSAIADAAAARDGLYRKPLPTLPPTPGSAVGMLVIPAIGLQQAVVEGVGASDTSEGPGHVPGTAGLGQPGNSAVVGRNAGDGGSFGNLGQLRSGDHIVTATTQGESLYVVTSVGSGAVVTYAPVTRVLSGPQSAGHSTSSTHKSSHAVHGKKTKTFNLQSLFGAAAHNQLTLVTSGSGTPWNSNGAVVVVARMKGEAFSPTPQESRSLEQQGTTGDANALPWLLLTLLAMALVMAISVALYRRLTTRSAYLVTTGPLLALTIVAALLASRLLPAWS